MIRISCTFDEFFKIRKELCIDEKYLLKKGYLGSKVSFDNVEEKRKLIPVFLKENENGV